MSDSTIPEKLKSVEDLEVKEAEISTAYTKSYGKLIEIQGKAVFCEPSQESAKNLKVLKSEVEDLNQKKEALAKLKVTLRGELGATFLTECRRQKESLQARMSELTAKRKELQEKLVRLLAEAQACAWNIYGRSLEPSDLKVSDPDRQLSREIREGLEEKSPISPALEALRGKIQRFEQAESINPDVAGRFVLARSEEVLKALGGGDQDFYRILSGLLSESSSFVSVV